MDETTIVPELDIDGLISYTKGCYVGQEIIARIHEVVAKQLKTQEARDLYAGQGHEIGGDGPDEYAAFLRAEIDKWAKVAKAAGIPKQ
jgi:tripartite-type tricarboxylate transporter receptor subunit TctC